MSLSFFIAHRLYCEKKEGRQISRPAVLIAKTGIAVGLAVMLVAVCVIVGFKSEVRDKIVGFGGHVQINNLEQMQPYEPLAIGIDDTLINSLAAFPNVKHIQRYSVKPGMIKTEKAFQGMVLKGVGQDYDLSFLRSHLIGGEFPNFTDSITSNQVVVSQAMAEQLELNLGDKLDTYYIENEIRIRRLSIVGIYCTGFAEYDSYFLFTDLHTVNRLNHFQSGQVSGIEVILDNYAVLENDTWEIGSFLEKCIDRYGAKYTARNVEQLNPAIFAWLGVLDVDIWVILVLMMGVAGFTMISGLLILIIERAAMIGTLKSLGANNGIIRRVFLWLSVFIIGRGMLWGNVIGLGFCLLQYYTGLLTLDAETYYMDAVPIAFNIKYLILLNAGTLLASVLILLGPSYLIARIRPADAMRFE
ncbi:ABC transporter permease [Bacteroides sp. ET71]|uniref:ABC transporter permease n=1 Tax=Bacteroides sp. ET71 TaxID=2939421 RepID=UPI002013694C|nr:FtsX-like permease family protein [Bacteroides sp. ET71]MCL1617568.1 ABC transporter permease [Bacteroides sp. ET71]